MVQYLSNPSNLGHSVTSDDWQLGRPGGRLPESEQRVRGIHQGWEA